MFPSKVTPLLTKLIFSPIMLCAHTKSCPRSCPRLCPRPCPERAKDAKGANNKRRGTPPPPPPSDTQTAGAAKLVRLMKGPKVRFGFLPDTWFTFFHSMTGVTGPYVFIIAHTNYLLSKEIYVLEHEYYLGLSACVIIVYAVKTFGKGAASFLDGEVKNAIKDYQKGRKDEIAHWENVIKTSSSAQESAKAQKLLMDAKKENIALQLEAITRERAMMVYVLVKGRMEYQMKRHMTTNRIHQKWMLAWILQRVKASITPEFEAQALNSAISDLDRAAQQFKK